MSCVWVVAACLLCICVWCILRSLTVFSFFLFLVHSYIFSWFCFVYVLFTCLNTVVARTFVRLCCMHRFPVQRLYRTPLWSNQHVTARYMKITKDFFFEQPSDWTHLLRPYMAKHKHIHQICFTFPSSVDVNSLLRQDWRISICLNINIVS